MIRLPAAAFAAVLFVVPVLTATVPAVTMLGLIGLLPAAVGIATHWRWPVTSAACVFLTDYAAAPWLADAPVSVAVAVGFGLSLLLLLESLELARCMRHATVDAGVARSLATGWFGFGAATPVATFSVMALAFALAALVPYAAAPFVAAAGALGAVLALARRCSVHGSEIDHPRLRCRQDPGRRRKRAAV